MPKGKREKKSGKVEAQFVGLASISDLARNATSFSDSTRPLFAQKTGSSYRLFEQGPKVGDTRLVFYAESKTCGNFLRYKPATASGGEVAELADTVSFSPPGGEMHNIPIVEIKANPFEEKKTAPKAICVPVANHSSIIKGTIMKALQHESIGKVYSFRSGSKTFIGSLGLIEEEDERVFCFAQTEDKGNFAFYRYNYQLDTIEQSNLFGEHQYLYVRVINLSQPFSFFKE